MFKTDKKSLEELSFQFDERDIAKLARLLEFLRTKDLLTISPKEAERALKGLEAIGKLQLDEEVYAFHVYDTYATQQGGTGEGVELYRRHGDDLRELLVPSDRDRLYQVDRAVEFLNECRITNIYTGDIPVNSKFLGLSYTCDKEDPITYSKLTDSEIEDFEDEGIHVIELERLI